MAIYDYFISYSSKDNDIAFKLVNAIESTGHTCWIAPRDIPYGTPYARAIMGGIDECDKFLVLITKNSIHSEDVLNEVDNAHALKKTIIPIRFSDIQLPRELNYYLSRTQWLKVSSANPEEITKLLNLGIVSSPAENIQTSDNKVTDNKKSKAIFFIVAVITMVGMIFGTRLYTSHNSKGNDHGELIANDNPTEEAVNVNDGSSDTDSTPSIPAVAVEKIITDNDKAKSKPVAKATESHKESKDYEQLINNANTYFNSQSPEEHKMALKLYEDIAINYDNTYADRVGDMYYDGKGTEKNPSKGIEWCKKAADEGNHKSQIKVGEWLLKSERFKEAANYYKMAEENGGLDARAKNNLGWLYCNGKGVDKDGQKTIKYWKSAADSGYVTAMRGLGDVYYNGDVVEQNYKEAYEWYSRAAKKGDQHSKNMIEVMRQQGLIVE